MTARVQEKKVLAQLMDSEQHCAYVVRVVCCWWCGTASEKRNDFHARENRKKKQEILATSYVRDVRTSTYVSNGLKQSEVEVRISKIIEDIGGY